MCYTLWYRTFYQHDKFWLRTSDRYTRMHCVHTRSGVWMYAADVRLCSEIVELISSIARPICARVHIYVHHPFLALARFMQWKPVVCNFSSSHETQYHTLYASVCECLCVWTVHAARKTTNVVQMCYFCPQNRSVNRMSVRWYSGQEYFSLFFFTWMKHNIATNTSKTSFLSFFLPRCCYYCRRSISTFDSVDTIHLTTQIFIILAFDVRYRWKQLIDDDDNEWVLIQWKNLFDVCREFHSRMSHNNEETIQSRDISTLSSFLTSAAINANVLSPPKNPTPTQMMNMKPDSVKIVDSNATSRKCDHPGVVGENESWKYKK